MKMKEKLRENKRKSIIVQKWQMLQQYINILDNVKIIKTVFVF
jgi:hypothetical protein